MAPWEPGRSPAGQAPPPCALSPGPQGPLVLLLARPLSPRPRSSSGHRGLTSSQKTENEAGQSSPTAGFWRKQGPHAEKPYNPQNAPCETRADHLLSKSKTKAPSASNCRAFPSTPAPPQASQLCVTSPGSLYRKGTGVPPGPRKPACLGSAQLLRRCPPAARGSGSCSRAPAPLLILRRVGAQLLSAAAAGWGRGPAPGGRASSCVSP